MQDVSIKIATGGPMGYGPLHRVSKHRRKGPVRLLDNTNRTSKHTTSAESHRSWRVELVQFESGCSYLALVMGSR